MHHTCTHVLLFNSTMPDYTNQQIPLKAISSLQGFEFIIPSYQRGYKWTSKNIEELINDFLDFIEKGDEKKMYCLQPLAVIPKGDKKFIVIDGQQRLTTIYLLYKALFNQNLYTFQFERDVNDESDNENTTRWEFLQKISGEISDKSVDQFFISTAYSKILEMTKNRYVNESLKKLLKAVDTEKSVQFIWYEVDSKKPHDTFRNLNSGKIQLSNSDLIKALFLNRVSGLKEPLRQQAADLLEQMEQELKNDSFWYMFNFAEQRDGQSRMDFIYNLVAKCKNEDYTIDPRWSFRNYFDNKEVKDKNGNIISLDEKWHIVRETYLRIRDMFEDPYIYHYIGFLTFSKNSNGNPVKLLEKSKTELKSKFINSLRDDISNTLKHNHHSTLNDYSYDSPKPQLRQLFLIYNIETILCRYEEAQKSNELALKGLFERFPFELLHKQQWDIEHIASKTENDKSSTQDQIEWLSSIIADLGEEFKNIGCEKEITEYQNAVGTIATEKFKKLYKKIMGYCEQKLGPLAIPDATDEESGRKDKNQLGNLTLLDSHTNRSFHNALFPRKRKIILVAGGLQSDAPDDNSIKRVFIPICTRQCFTKSYRRSPDVNLNAWIQPDADAYYKDIELKLSKYFK